MPRTTTSSGRSSRRSSGCKAAAMGCGGGGGLTSMLGKESTMAMSGQSSKCPAAATCPVYTGLVIWGLVVYGFFASMLWAFRPTFVLKVGASRADPNSPNVTATALYSLLFSALVLLLVGLIVRCSGCRA